ncbi:Fe-S-cluster containining protein [Methanolinea mesophila]|nr:Fe-S-cluster containining protein [Methanolinea mesophila]
MDPRSIEFPFRLHVPRTEGALADLIRALGFSCIRCGECCRAKSGDEHLVLVSPDEVREIAVAGGGSWESVAEPFPCFTPHGSAGSHTFEWCLRREGDRCRFLRERGGFPACSVYLSRPWICRTYPFVLEGEDLLVYPCPGLSRAEATMEAEAMAADLLARQCFEREEEERVRKVFEGSPLPQGRVVIDGDGMKVLHG